MRPFFCCPNSSLLFHALEAASRVHAQAVGLLLCDLNLDFPDQESVPQSKGDAPRVVHQHY